TRTNLYWYSPERRYFWHRMGNQQLVRRFGDLRTGAAGLTVAEAGDFYQALVVGQLVAIGAGRSLLKPETTERLLSRLRTRSLLAAPIRVQGELLGFLAVEDNAPRIWEEVETNYVRAMAQIVALVVGTEEMEEALQLASQDARFGAEIARAIVRNNDTTSALKDCAGLLCKRLESERLLILQEDDRGQFIALFQQHPSNRRPLSTPLNSLSQATRQSLCESAEAVMVENLDKDWRLLPWRESLIQQGVRSLLLVSLGKSLPVSSTSTTNSAEKLSLLVIAHGTPRTWNSRSRDVASIVAQQISLLLKLAQLHDSASSSLIAHQTFESGLSTLAQAPLDPILFDCTWLEYLATLLECPLAVILSWTPEHPHATIAAEFVADRHWSLSSDLAIPVANNTLIQDALATHGFISRPVAAFGAATRKWLNNPGLGQLLVIALHTEAMPTTAIVVLADHEERYWSPQLLPPLETLTRQFAWFRYYRHYLSQYQQAGESLQTLNWYKHRCLETFYQSVQESVRILLELDAKTSLPTSADEFNQRISINSSETSTTPATTSQPLRQAQRQQLLHQLEQTLAVLTPVLTEEQWQLTVNLRPVPLAGLLKRSLHHIAPLYAQRQLMAKVHNPGRFRVYGDRLKLECILFELLTTSCFYAQPGSRINLWCSSLEFKDTGSQDNFPYGFSSEIQSSTSLIELSIAESGFFDKDLSTLQSLPTQPPPNLNLQICQDILRAWGGDLQFYQLDAERYLSRLLLPSVRNQGSSAAGA
ncbi:MAG: GAF domain-containing protein, partial [Coleofasciculus sp. S288]|nr:GAF domain-containing protein [Coleofasciculus sp. S288]